MNEEPERDAWIRILTEEEMRARMTAATATPYEFGFLPAMGRLLVTHERIGIAFRALFRQVMYEPGVLSRAECEMVAGVAAAAQDCHY